MIPVLLGSTRIPDKNLLMVDGSPMLFYAVQACKDAGVFDEIYVNSENKIFGQMAQKLGVHFYPRRPERGGSVCQMSNRSCYCKRSRCQTHDHFLFDFMETIEPCRLVMVHTTSPLLSSKSIRDFVATLKRDGYDSLVSVEKRFAEAFYEGKPVNFSMFQKSPTQGLKPLQIVSWALSGWKTKSFRAAYQDNRPDAMGPTFCGKSSVFQLNHIEALDVDTWDDLHIVDACLRYKRAGIHLNQSRFSYDKEPMKV
jgi:CMP-N-acetylneuraminic acid synthetase